MYELARSRKTKKLKIFLLGTIGTSKTYIMALIFINIARQYPNSFIPIGRITLADARTSTAHVFAEVLSDMGLIEGRDYRAIGMYGGNTIMFVFENKSRIQFMPVDETKDRDWRRARGVPATCVGFDEVDTVAQGGFVALSSRAGRKNRPSENGVAAPDITIATCNPNETWVKEHIYKPYKKGTLPDDVKVVEFFMEDSFLFKEGYYDGFLTNPEQWKQRFLFNNWDYLDDEDSLFKSRVLDNIHVSNYAPKVNYMGVDVAREGKDRSVFVRIVGNTLVDIKIYTKSDLDRLASDDEKDAPPYSNILGREALAYADKHSIGWQHSAADAVGNGAGFIDYTRSQKRPFKEYKAGARPLFADDPDVKKGERKPKFSIAYDMLRSQMYDQLAKAMENGEFFFLDSCPHLADLKQELLWHLYDSKDKQLAVEKKDQIKKRLGKSPDIADALCIAFYASQQKKIGTYGSTVKDKETNTFTGGLLDMRF